MRALVLGGNGFIGSHLVDKLAEEKHCVSVLDIKKELYRKPLVGVHYFHADFRDHKRLNLALKDIDVVFHLLGTTLPKTSNDDMIFDVKTNLIGTLLLLEKCVENRIKKIVYFSSGGTIYGRAKKFPLSEDAPTHPECSYGITRLAVEKYLALFKRLYGLDYVIIRPSNPYGERQNYLGAQGAISVFLGRIAKGKPLEIWGNGEMIRDYIYVKDLAHAVYNAAVLKTTSRIYNIGSGKGISINRLIKIMRKVTSRTIKINYFPQRQCDVPKVYLDITKARMDLAWRPTTSLDKGIERTWYSILGAIQENT